MILNTEIYMIVTYDNQMFQDVTWKMPRII